MRTTRRAFMAGTATGVAALTITACSESDESASNQVRETTVTETATTSTLALDMAAWRYSEEDDAYYQTGIAYCETPADEAYESLALFVPGPYFQATDNGDGTYTCSKTADGAVGTYSAETAPIVMPVNTPGYAAMSPLTEYSSSVADFTAAGFVYAHAGCRGRDHGAPAGVTDLKAAVRFMRQVADVLPGSVEHIFTFGMSGGGAQSALMGATGDSALFEPYLAAIGATMNTSDAIYGSMDWCPITGLDVGDAAYEWMMGCTREGLTDEEQAISDGLAEQYAAYLNAAGIKDENGEVLTLEESAEGLYQAGSYYERVLATIEQSLNDFLADTAFPYDASTASSGFDGGMGGGNHEGMGGGGRPEGMPEGIGDDELPDGMPEGAGDAEMHAGREGTADTEGGETDFAAIDDIARTGSTSTLSLDGTYETAADYVAALNADGAWVTLDETTNTVQVSSVASFVKALKGASKRLGAFDQLDRGQGENTLFGFGGDPRHFDALLAQVLDQIGSSYAPEYADDLALTDELGIDMQTRVNMYTPLNYLLATADGYGTSMPARHWRIRSGINQGDTALTTELNLALALENDGRVETVDFASVWGQGHTKAERTGDSQSNFIAWVQSLV